MGFLWFSRVVPTFFPSKHFPRNVSQNIDGLNIVQGHPHLAAAGTLPAKETWGRRGEVRIE